MIGIATRWLACLLLIGVGCAQTFDFHECDSDSDCDHLRGDGGVLYCSQEHICVSKLPDERLCPVAILGTGAGAHLAIASLVARTDELDQGMEKAFRLAAEEINSLQGGASQPPIDLYLCDMGEINIPNQSVDAVRYAHEHYGIAAVVGPTATGDVVAINPYIVQHGILVISPSATSTVITALDDDRLVWRTAPSDALQAALLARLVEKEHPARIDVIHVNNLDGNGLADSIQLAFANVAGLAVHRVLSFEEGGEGLAQAVAALAEDGPDAVVMIADVDVPTLVAEVGMVAGLESARLFMTDAAKTTSLFGPPGDRVPASVLERIRGTGPATPAGSTFDLFANAYENAYGFSPQDSAFSANAYDAVYLVAVAAAATQGRAPGGKDLRAGLLQLQATGEAVPVGRASYLSAVAQMQAGGVRLVGASGPLDFDDQGDPANGAFEEWRIDTSGSEPAFVTVTE